MRIWRDEQGTTRLSITRDDCRRDTFRCGGKGGQNVQKRDTGVRFTHEPSGAVGECREERQQGQNERTAWRRMAEDPRLTRWINMQVAAFDEGYANAAARVDAMLAPENIRVEVGEDAAECKRGEDHCDKGDH